ncbi:MAG: putative oxidoreductase, aryl-alcohol dehydrogenase like protein [Actinomycetia bacterium]|nr:putative oxidoreductase, aryl-alcohol dehydrogenase like protein [Actinomycetes bacterium]
MEMVTLGMTDLLVSPIAYGAWELGGEWGSVDENEAIETIRHARDRGINLFDTAQAYGFGASERILGQALREDLDLRRGEIVIATKGGLRLTENGLERDSSPAWLRRGVENSLQSLAVDYIDIYQVHWPDPNVDLAETAGALQELVQEGKIRHVGVSNFDTSQMAEFARTRPVETLQPPYSLFRREIETDVLPYTEAHGIGVLAYGPLAHGLLSGGIDGQTTFAADDWRSTNPSFQGETLHRNLETVGELQRFASEEFGTSVAQLAVAWTLANPAVDVAIVGARRAQYIDDAMTASELRLTEAELANIDRVMSGAMAFTGPSPDLMPTR